MKETAEKLNWVKREIIFHRYPLTEAEKMSLAEEMADAKLKISELEFKLSEIKKEYKEKLDAETGRLNNAAGQFKSGLALPVEVECDMFQAFDTEEIVYRRAGDAVEIQRRPMRNDEKMPTLFSLMNEDSSNRIQFRGE